MAVAGARIHPTAVVHSDARVADDVEIGPYCVVGPKVTIGAGTKLVAHVFIDGRTTIGGGNRIFPFASIGAEPQDLKYGGEESELRIGDENTIRESVTINTGTDNGGGLTSIGHKNLLMACSHVAHDCRLEDGIILSNAALLAGHVKVESNVVISGAALVHHFVTIGKYAFVAGGAAANVDVPPFMMLVGQRQKVQTINAVGLKRRGFSKEAIDALREAHRIVWRQGLPRPEAIRKLKKKLGTVAEVADLIASLTASLRGKNGRALEALRRDVP